MAEVNGRRIATVFTTDAELDVRASLLTQFRCSLDELANANLVEFGEGVAIVDLLLVVSVEEVPGIVTRETEGHLCEVVRPEGEELSMGGDLVSGEGRAGDLNHGADAVFKSHT